jgi:hypothetical protein
MIDVHGEGVYKRHRIHVCRLISGAYAAAVVQCGAKGSGVVNVPGKYRSRDEAVLAAKEYIDGGKDEGDN